MWSMRATREIIPGTIARPPKTNYSPPAPGISRMKSPERTCARRVAAFRRNHGNRKRARNYFSEFGSE
jgi:hypothetical protein